MIVAFDDAALRRPDAVATVYNLWARAAEGLLVGADILWTLSYQSFRELSCASGDFAAASDELLEKHPLFLYDKMESE